MRTYSIHIHDDRYEVPTLLIAGVRDEVRVGELAREKLKESPHYRAIEVIDDGRILFRVEREQPA